MYIYFFKYIFMNIFFLQMNKLTFPMFSKTKKKYIARPTPGYTAE